jgi:hypothetical protein
MDVLSVEGCISSEIYPFSDALNCIIHNNSFHSVSITMPGRYHPLLKNGARRTPYPQPQTANNDSEQIPRTPSKTRSCSRSPSVGRSALSSPALSTCSTVPDGELETLAFRAASKCKRIRSYNDLPHPHLREACRTMSQLISEHTIFNQPFFAGATDWKNITKNGLWLEVIEQLGFGNLEYTSSVDALVRIAIQLNCVAFTMVSVGQTIT